MGVASAGQVKIQILAHKIYSMNLTTRQNQVLAARMRGLAIQDISLEVGISINTTKMHLKRLHIKYGAKTGLELANAVKLQPVVIDDSRSLNSKGL